MGREKFLVLVLFIIVCISVVSGHSNHSHDDNTEEGEFSGLLDSYSSGTALGVIEVTLGIVLMSLAGFHYYRSSG